MDRCGLGPGRRGLLSGAPNRRIVKAGKKAADGLLAKSNHKLEFDKPDGYNFVKFDGLEKAADGSQILLLDAKPALPLRIPGAMRDLADRHSLIRSALEQNAEEYGSLFKIVYEFPNTQTASAAERYLAGADYSDLISVRVRQQ